MMYFVQRIIHYLLLRFKSP